MRIFQINRHIRSLVVLLAAIAVILLTTSTSAAAENDLAITVYRDPSCNCCGGWIDYLTVQGFKLKNVLISDMNALKQQYGVPNDLVSCHTAVIDGYVIEGHVPADYIKRLLAEQPNVTGIAVPGMPIGTPGMESGDVREPFTVLSFDQQGTEAFN